MQRIEEEDSVPTDSSLLSDYERRTLLASPTMELTPQPTQLLVHVSTEELRDEIEDAVEMPVEVRKSVVKEEASRSTEGRKSNSVEVFPMLVRGFETFKSDPNVKKSDSMDFSSKEGLILKAKLMNEESSLSSDGDFEENLAGTAGHKSPDLLEIVTRDDIDPEERLRKALDEKIPEKRRLSITERLGFANKKLDNELLERAYDELQSLHNRSLRLLDER